MSRAIFQPPKLRREECEEGERSATWLELFFDLIFVVAIALLGLLIAFLSTNAHLNRGSS